MAHNSKWSESEIHCFINDWKDDILTMNMLMTKYSRSKKALLSQAFRLGLKPRVFYTKYLTVSDICDEMSVSKSTVYRWIKTGLKTRRCASESQKYLIHADDLLAYLEENQSKFDASKISKYLFITEPDWLIDKRKHDAMMYKPDRKMVHRKVFTISDIAFLKQYSDNYTLSELSSMMNGRSENSIKFKCRSLNLPYHISKSKCTFLDK